MNLWGESPLWVNQQAIAQELTPVFDPEFSENSVGFRPRRSAHDGVRQVKQTIKDSYQYAVDVDLSKFFACKIKPCLKGEAWLIRYIDDFVVCFQHRSDAERFLNVLPKRLGKFGLKLEPDKTWLVQFGRFAHRQKKRPETVYFLGLKTVLCNLL